MKIKLDVDGLFLSNYTDKYQTKRYVEFYGNRIGFITYGDPGWYYHIGREGNVISSGLLPAPTQKKAGMQVYYTYIRYRDSIRDLETQEEK